MIKKGLQYIKRTLTRPEDIGLDSVSPVSRYFGLDRGTPIDRYYIEEFLKENKLNIKGKVLEIAESTYSKKFGSNVSAFEVLHATAGNSLATIVGDLTNVDTLPQSAIDCFICTHTFNFIYEVENAVKGAHHLLAPNGIMLATVAGISQISRYDADRWGDYWRFTSDSATKLCEDVFGIGNVEVKCFGNCYAVINFLRGISCEEVSVEKLNIIDPDYPLVITIKAKKTGMTV
jgi:hypothetical protein